MRKSALPLKSEMMSTAINEKTYALFANSANRKLADKLEKTGAKVFQFPPIENERIVLDESSVDKLKNLAQFDWLIFSDVLAADYFLENLEENKIDFYETDFLRIYVYGEAVADRLRFVQIHSDVIPSTIKIEKIFSAIVDYVGEAELKNESFLILKEASGKSDLKERLSASGAAVFELPVYQAKIKNNLEIIKLKTLLEGGAIDEFIFSSPTDFIWIERYFSQSLKKIFTEIKVSATDGVNFQTAREHELESVGLFHLDKLDKVNK